MLSNFFNKGTQNQLSSINFLGTNERMIGKNMISTTMTLREFINAVLEGVIVDYEKNRGTGKLNTTHVREIAEQYDANRLGVVNVVDNGDGTFKLADFHHRKAAILAKFRGEYDCAPFTNEELSQNLSVHTAPSEEFFNNYTGLNSNHRHSSKQKALNTDLGLGAMIDEILSLQKVDSVILPNFHTTIARCAYGFLGEIKSETNNIKDLSYADISLDRKAVSADAGLTKEEFGVDPTDAEKKKIANALDYVNAVYNEFMFLNNISKKKDTKVKLNDTGRSLMRNAGLYGFLLWDKLSGREYVTYLSPKNLAYRITEKDAQIERQSKFILNSELRESTAEKIVAYITTKKRV